MKLAWHEMVCPKCYSDTDLEVVFTGTCNLTYYGSDDQGNHEWDNESLCTCTNCGAKGPVKAFKFESNEKGDLELKGDPEADDFVSDVKFQIVVSKMVIDPETGNYVLAANFNDNRDIELYSVEMRRTHFSTGIIEVLDDFEYDEVDKAEEMVKGLALHYASFEPGEEWV